MSPGSAKVRIVITRLGKFVNKSDQTTKEDRGRAALRHTYIKPNLRMFGSVGNLTQSGTGVEQEGTGMDMAGPMFRT